MLQVRGWHTEDNSVTFPGISQAERHLHCNVSLHIPAGVVGAVVLPVTGATVGLVQVTRGAINTVEAVSEASKGRIWDEVSWKPG